MAVGVGWVAPQTAKHEKQIDQKFMKVVKGYVSVNAHL